MSVTGSVTAEGNRVAETYGGTTQNLTDYPIGTILFVDGNTASRNSTHTLYLGGDSTNFGFSGTTALVGTWNARGTGKFGSGGSATLFQRVA